MLLVALELCTLAVRHDELTKANIVAASLFGDGAAAVVLRAGDGGAIRVEATGEKQWPDTLDIMGWSVDPEGFGVIFQRTIPDFVRDNIGPAVTEILARMELSTHDIDRFVCHPGGTKVILALERALSLDQGTLDHEREVIADYGNMSAPTVLFVLERALRAGPAAAVAAHRARTRLHRELRRAAARGVSVAAVILALVTLQRIGELVLARHNTAKLMARGAIEIGAGHYPLIVSVHAAWLIALWLWGRDQDVNLLALSLFVALQGVRLWVLATLGPRWTTRIIVLPGAPLVTSGPYRYFSHPNYAVVVAEIALLPLALHLPWLALVFTVLNAAVLVIRIRVEARALAAVDGQLARRAP